MSRSYLLMVPIGARRRSVALPATDQADATRRGGRSTRSSWSGSYAGLLDGILLVPKAKVSLDADDGARDQMAQSEFLTTRP
jgi:hypothetical protein